MEKRQQRGLFTVPGLLLAFCSLGTPGFTRTTERSESVSEEAEERLMRYFLLTHLCGISHRNGALSVQSALMPHS